MESIEKLRYYIDHGINHRDELIKLIDAIEREIAEKYMLLPVDAYGVPIRVGDTLQLGDTRGEVIALTYRPNNGELPWEYQCDTGGWYNTAFARHAKPRTVEDVLREFSVYLVQNASNTKCVSNAIAEFSQELRMAGDSE